MGLLVERSRLHVGERVFFLGSNIWSQLHVRKPLRLLLLMYEARFLRHLIALFFLVAGLAWIVEVVIVDFA